MMCVCHYYMHAGKIYQLLHGERVIHMHVCFTYYVYAAILRVIHTTRLLTGTNRMCMVRLRASEQVNELGAGSYPE